MAFDPKAHLIVAEEKYFDKDLGKTMIRKKAILPARARIQWVRSDYPPTDLRITSELAHIDDIRVVVRAKILDANGDVLSTALYEMPLEVKHAVATAETLAIGRALAFMGYGTEYLDLPEEEGHIPDSPVVVKDKIPVPEEEQKEVAATVKGVGATVSTANVQEAVVEATTKAVTKKATTKKDAAPAKVSAKGVLRAATKKKQEPKQEQEKKPMSRSEELDEMEKVEAATNLILKQVAALTGSEPTSVDDFAIHVLGHPILDLSDARAVQKAAGELLEEVQRANEE